MIETPQNPIDDKEWLNEAMDSLKSLTPEVRQKLEEADADTLGLIRQSKNAFEFQKKAMAKHGALSFADYKHRYDFVDKFLNLRQRQLADSRKMTENARTQMQGLLESDKK